MKHRLLPALLVTFLLAAGQGRAADPLVIVSPEQGSTWAYSKADHRQFDWDAKSGTFSLFLTYNNEDQASRTTPIDSETLRFPLPGIVWDEKTKLFVTSLSDGKTVPVARKAQILFLPEIRLLPRSHLQVERKDDKVRVSLEIVP